MLFGTVGNPPPERERERERTKVYRYAYIYLGRRRGLQVFYPGDICDRYIVKRRLEI